MQYYLTDGPSTNRKTGGMPVATISKKSCPDSCALKNNGCYAEAAPLSWHWDKITRGEKGVDFATFLEAVRKLPYGLWRYGQAGDLPGEGDVIDKDQLVELAKANRRRPVICFTHKPSTTENLEAINLAKEYSFHINLSGNNLTEADKLAETGHSVVTILPSEYGRRQKGGVYLETKTEYRERMNGLKRTTPAGRKIAVCPATYTSTTCLSCGVCAKARPQGTVIGFPAHGNRTRRVDDLVRNGDEKLQGATAEAKERR